MATRTALALGIRGTADDEAGVLLESIENGMAEVNLAAGLVSEESNSDNRSDAPEETAAAGNNATRQPGLLRLAVELRDMIYEHLIDPGTVDICSKPPSIAQVCSKMRHECLAMYIAKSNFTKHLGEQTDRNGCRSLVYNHGRDYQNLLDRLAHLGVEHVRGLKSLTIICHDSWEYRLPGHPYSRTCFTNFSLVDRWNAFIPKLFALGIQEHQLRCPGLQTDKAWPDFHQGSIWNAFRLAILYEGIIGPALQLYGPQSSQSILPDILEQARTARDPESRAPLDKQEPLHKAAMEEYHEFVTKRVALLSDDKVRADEEQALARRVFMQPWE